MESSHRGFAGTVQLLSPADEEAAARQRECPSPVYLSQDPEAATDAHAGATVGWMSGSTAGPLTAVLVPNRIETRTVSREKRRQVGQPGVPPRWLPAPSATAPTSPARWRRRPADAYAMSFSFLSGRTFTHALAGSAFTSIVSPGRDKPPHLRGRCAFLTATGSQ